ncbi:NADP-reducing hydrogenase subunit HndA [Desulfosporosinus acididurans]|uniref:NADP-reducing hydrogenase subunit HndA n=1 Tax=Desulfosporosinus acididurans TaxID=476652 RepID=A0A0J1FUH7_9FIRM|nr:NAD(P)H-dependent oxidoreductase subunit E [Desulfosporosinus acididurans]KLU66962.1 NADP-reducing hydrogenase subunit HndA [Desulfosporosinus acididurans]
MEKVDEVLEKFRYAKEDLIQILLELQMLSGKNYLPQEWVEYVAKALDMPMNKVYGVMTFYGMFSTKPRGKNLIEVCKSGPCHVSGSQGIELMLEKELAIKPGETTDDGLFTLERSNCFGACDIAPAIKIGEKVYGNLTPDSLRAVIKSYREEA